MISAANETSKSPTNIIHLGVLVLGNFMNKLYCFNDKDKIKVIIASKSRKLMYAQRKLLILHAQLLSENTKVIIASFI